MLNHEIMNNNCLLETTDEVKAVIAYWVFFIKSVTTTKTKTNFLIFCIFDYDFHVIILTIIKCEQP